MENLCFSAKNREKRSFFDKITYKYVKIQAGRGMIQGANGLMCRVAPKRENRYNDNRVFGKALGRGENTDEYPKKTNYIFDCHGSLISY